MSGVRALTDLFQAAGNGLVLAIILAALVIAGNKLFPRKTKGPE